MIRRDRPLFMNPNPLTLGTLSRELVLCQGATQHPEGMHAGCDWLQDEEGTAFRLNSL